MRPSGAHVHGHGSPAEVIGVAAAVVAVVAVLAFVAEHLWQILTAFAVLILAAIAGLVWLARHGADVATVQRRTLPSQQRAALPAPSAAPIAARPVRALPAPPPQVVNHIYVLTPEQAARVTAEQRREIEGR